MVQESISQKGWGFETIYECKPRGDTSPFEKRDPPGIEAIAKFDIHRIKKIQTMIRGLQWAVSLGRFAMQTATMPTSRFLCCTPSGSSGSSKTNVWLSKEAHKSSYTNSN
jgi:hypothetical protein